MNKQVYEIVGRVLGCPVNEINEDTSPDTLVQWDSLKHMNLILALEEELGVQFSDDQIVEMNSVGLILAVLEEINSKK